MLWRPVKVPVFDVNECLMNFTHRTWILTNEPIMDPPRVLKEECEKAGLEEGAFTVSALGETIVV